MKLLLKTFLTKLNRWAPLRQLTLGSQEEIKIINRSFGTFLVLFSGLVMYLDKAIEYYNVQVNYEFKYYVDLDVFLWSIGQTIAILLVSLGCFFKPYRWALLSPIIVFSMQFTYVLRDEEWIQGEFYILYTGIFIMTLFTLIFFIKYMIRKVGHIIQKSKKKDVDALINFVIEVRNEHYAKMLESADSLELLDDFNCDEIEKAILKDILRRERLTNTKKFEIRLVQTLHKVHA
ncbi:MAG: hypothetical protein AAF575_13390 [Bacteroidota bacterium]